MADEPVVVQGINWKETFPFTQIFRTFRLAIHPSKLILALLALLGIYFGGRVLDAVWPDEHNGVPNEIGMYEAAFDAERPRETFLEARREERQSIVADYRGELKRIGHENGDLGDIKWRLKQERDERVTAAQKAYEAADKSTPEAAERARGRRDAAVRLEYDRAAGRWEELKAVEGLGLFRSFYEYQLGQVNRLVAAVRSWNWFGPLGATEALFNFFVIGPAWAMQYHYIYFLLFGLYFLAIWAIFGGAISRIAAVHAARDEKISIRQALAFSSSKFLSFISAPIIPLLIILVVGLVLAVGGLVGNIPVIGPPLIAIFFFLALAAGFVMTLVLIGLIGGFNLMYPTIAVEGSDSFDAISRSFSYLYARPWRLIFYSLVALVYGVLTYIFVRLFIRLLLILTHAFVGLFFFRDAPSGANLWNTMWPPPTRRLVYDVDFLTLNWAQDLAAGVLSFWVYLTIGMLGAFAISFYFSANTIIYYLMRHEVDATELDDVYLEQSDEEFIEGVPPAVAAATPAPAGAAPEVAGPTPAAAPVAGSDVPAGPSPEAAAPVMPPPDSSAGAGGEQRPPDQQDQPPV